MRNSARAHRRRGGSAPSLTRGVRNLGGTSAALALVLAACTGADTTGHGGGGSGGGGGAGPSDPPPVSTSPGDGLARFVDPFIGTGDSAAPSPVTNGRGGSTFPGAALPFGMSQWSPDTPHAAPAGYHFGDGEITGFSLTHLSGAGCTAKRDFPVFPVVGAWDPSTEPRDTFDHAAEIASPGFYEVTLGSGIRVDLTATQRGGLARFTFPSAADARVLVSGGWAADVLTATDFAATLRADGVVVGHRTNTFFCGTSGKYTMHFAARFDRAPKERGTWSNGTASPGETSVEGAHAGVYLTFDTTEQRVVHMRVGLSYVSEDAALANLDGEEPKGFDFDAVHQAAIDRWNGYLGRVLVEGGTDDDRRALYTALYHALLQPGVASDLDGSFIGFDDSVKKDAAHPRYVDFSGWDIYRSWVQLAAVIAPEETRDMMGSLVSSGQECGALPRWSLASFESGVMIGDPAAALIASARAFGVTGFGEEDALALMKKSATDEAASCDGHLARPALAAYAANGYVASDAPGAPAGAPAVTLEYAIADFALARYAAALGDQATSDAMMARALAWKNVFDPTLTGEGFTGYMAPRKLDGSFEAVDVGKNQGFVEGNAAQYTFLVPHDVAGLVTALGGDDAAIARLDALFTEVNAGLDRPHFYMGNEPGFGTPWAYAFAGAPARTQTVVRRILSEAFSLAPGGLPGNDDLGATSSWQVWAMLGLYPAIPGEGGLVLGSPVFSKATIALAGGKSLVITTTGAGPYVQGATVNGVASTSTWLPWSSVAAGGTVDLALGASESSTWGVAPADRPPSFYP